MTTGNPWLPAGISRKWASMTAAHLFGLLDARYRRRVSENVRTWFAREVLPHEAALMRYLARACADPEQVPDLRQDVYVKVYETAQHRRPVVTRAFLLTI